MTARPRELDGFDDPGRERLVFEDDGSVDVEGDQHPLGETVFGEILHQLGGVLLLDDVDAARVGDRHSTGSMTSRPPR